MRKGRLKAAGDLTKPAATDEEAERRIDNCFTLAGEEIAAQDWARICENLRRLRDANATIAPRILFRPLLTSGCIAKGDGGYTYILIDSEQPELEQIIAVWHEALHLLGLTHEDDVEALAQRLAAAFPEILPMVKKIAYDAAAG